MAKLCKCCGFRIPSLADLDEARKVACSPDHVRCIRCEWPVAKTLIDEHGLCYFCMDGYERRKYNRRIGRLLYGAADGSTDPKDYLVGGRMYIHGDEERHLAKRRGHRIPHTDPATSDQVPGPCQWPECSNIVRTPGNRYCCQSHSLKHRWQLAKQAQEPGQEDTPVQDDPSAEVH